MISSQTLQLFEAAVFNDGRGDRARRDGAREALERAGRELGFDPSSPPLPRFDDGETLVEKAAAVLKVDVRKELEQHRAREAAKHALADRIAGLRVRRRELVAAEQARLRDEVMKGKTPAKPPAAALGELRQVNDELALIGDANPGMWNQVFERQMILDRFQTPVEAASLAVYASCVAGRLEALTRGQPHGSKGAQTAKHVAAEAHQLSSGRFHADEDVAGAARRGRLVVEFAELHPPARTDLTVDELAAAQDLRRLAATPA